MFKFIISLLFFVNFISIATVAQDIKTPLPNSKSDSIYRLRLALYDKFLQKDITAVKKIKKELLLKEDDNYEPLNIIENITISYFTKEYSDILVLSRKEMFLNTNKNQVSGDRIDFSNMPGYKKLFNLVRADSTNVLLQVQKAEDLSIEQRDFLQLFFTHKFLSTTSFYNRTNDDLLNTAAKNFLTKYPETLYSRYIKEQMLFITKPNGNGSNYEFFSGTALFDNKLQQHFATPVVVGVGIGFTYAKFTLDFKVLAAVSGKLKQDIPINHVTWNKKERYTFAALHINLGYPVLDNKKIKLLPFIGVSGSEISPGDKIKKAKPELEKFTYKLRLTPSAGMQLDYKLKQENFGINSLLKSETVLRFRYSFTSNQFKAKHPEIMGNVQSISLGIASNLIGQKLER